MVLRPLVRLAVGVALAAAQGGADTGAELRAAPDAVECGPLDEAGVELLQRGHAIEGGGEGSRAPSRAARSAEPEELPNPTAWFHVPKAGASFAETLLGSEQLCGDAAGMFDQKIVLDELEEYCPGIWSPHRCTPSSFTAGQKSWSECSEQGFLGDIDEMGRHLVGFFRQPEQRLLSDYSMLCGDDAIDPSCADKAEFFRQHQACATKMLTSETAVVDHCVSETEPTAEDVLAAEQRLDALFAFVGITEKWDLSICLFNAKFNNPCKASQFASSWHVNSTEETHGLYDVEMLDGFVDTYDGVLYARALAIFEADLVRFGVTEENCVKCTD